MNAIKFKIAAYRYLGGAMNGYEVVRPTDIGDTDMDLMKISETLEVELTPLPEEGRNLKLEEILLEIDRVEEESTSRLSKLIEKKEILLRNQNQNHPIGLPLDYQLTTDERDYLS